MKAGGIKKLFILLSVFFLLSCGLEDDVVYFQEPQNVVIDNQEGVDILVKFLGYNQEVGKTPNNDKYVFVGYDIYYYFSSQPGTKKKAMVKNTKITKNTKLLPFPNVDLNYDPTQSDIKNKRRFPESNFASTMDTFYKEVSFPVTIDMISNVLKDDINNNVRFSFDVNNMDTSKEMNNPYSSTDTSYPFIFLGGIFPNEDDYYDKLWGNEADGYTFFGFYDMDYYDYLGITPYSDDGAFYKFYKVYFYIVAKGFKDADVSNRNRSYVESYQSSHIEVRFKVAYSTKDHQL